MARTHAVKLVSILTFTVSAAYVFCQRIPASPDSAAGQLIIIPPATDWSQMTSTAFFSKPTTLLEHRDLNKLRGIVSSRTSTLKKGIPFNEVKRLGEICKNIPASYAATRNHTVVSAKVTRKGIPHCRIQVHDKEGLVIEQLVFVSQGAGKVHTYTTHTITFFYPLSEEEKATQEVSKFIAFVRRGNG